jgi:3-phenylpropionate/trans-cinnamate dioxygenase ferredoxin subunit
MTPTESPARRDLLSGSFVFVGQVSEIPPGQRKIVTVNGREIGLFNVSGVFCALRNLCPHQGAPLCRGAVDGLYLPSAPGQFIWGRAGEILTCPWHAWEFDLLTGRSLANPKVRVRTYPVTVVDGSIYLSLERQEV